MADRRRLTVAVGVMVLAGAVVTLSRAGLAPPDSTSTAVPARVVVSGEVVQLAVGDQRIYALLNPCADQRTSCAPLLVASDDEGRTWTRRQLPGDRPAGAVQTWQLTALQPGSRLAIEAGGVLYVNAGDRDDYKSWPLSQGEAAAQVPASLSGLVGLCEPPACERPVLQYLDPGTGQLHRLQRQPPLDTRAVAVRGSSLWAAGIDPRTHLFGVTVSSDGGRTWQPLTLPATSTDDTLIPTIVLAPRRNQAYLLLGYPDDQQKRQSIYDV